MNRIIKIASYWLCLLWLASCTAGGSADTPCQRACGNRPVGGGNLEGIAYTDDVSLICAANQTAPQQTLYFLIYESTKAPAADTGQNNGEPTAQVPERLPKAGIAFTPMVPSGVTVDTPSSDWCTDSCGIAEIKFTPTCGVRSSGAVMPVVPGMTTDKMPRTSYSMTLPEN